MANVTNSNTTAPQGLEVCSTYSDVANAFKITGYIVILVLSMSGNTIILALFARGRKKRKLDPFIISIAVSGILVPFFGGIRELNSWIIRSDEWQVEGTLGDILCKICSFMTDISPIISILSMCCITVYQFIFVTFMITKPTRMTQGRLGETILVNSLVVSTWFIAIAYNSHYFHTYKLYPLAGKYFCDGPFFADPETYQSYLIATCVIFIIIPFGLITTLNVFVAYKVRKQLKNSSGSFPQWQREHSQKQRRNQAMVILMIVVFAACWGPLGVVVWLYAFKLHNFSANTCSYAVFHFISIFMTHSNAAINPWIYLFFFVFPERYCRSVGGTLSMRPQTSVNMMPLRRMRKVKPAPIAETAEPTN